MQQKRIRTLIVDDSAIARRLITESLSRDPAIEVVGTAIDPYFARDKILALNPDVITLDIEMPRMDGLTFLKLIMKHRPMPVIVMSSLTSEGSNKAMEALQYGAVDVMDKPNGPFSAHTDGLRLAEKIKAAAEAKVGSRQAWGEGADTGAKPTSPSVSTHSQATHTSVPQRSLTPKPASPAIVRRANPSVFNNPLNPRSLILMGASTGGTEALKTVLTALPNGLPGICIVQHIPAKFSTAFANRLNELCAFEVREAKHGDRVQPGLALVAPGGFHMVVKWNGGFYTVQLNEGPPVHHQRPAVDVMFNSALQAGAAPSSLVVLLTGMGADGASGMRGLCDAGAHTIAQNEETCVVFGMPREAIRMGAARSVLPLDQIALHMQRHFIKPQAASTLAG